MAARKTTTAPEPDTNGTTEDPSPAADAVTHGDAVTTIAFRGQKFTFPASRAMWPTRAMQAFQKRANVDGIELLLGARQWDLFNTVAPTIGDFWEFFVLFAGAADFVKLDEN